MLTGVVKWYDPEKGFGFILRDDEGDDLFVHRSATGYEELREGDRLEFDLGAGLKGPCASNVRVVERGTAPPRPLSPRSMSGAYPGAGFAPRAAVELSTLPLRSGVIRRFDPDKGFGFIRQQDPEQPDVFFHQSVVAGLVREGEPVQFRLGVGPKGLRAESVHPLGIGDHGSATTP